MAILDKAKYENKIFSNKRNMFHPLNLKKMNEII